MATTDLSRDATNFRKHYSGTLMQQGRVLTDDDFNEAARLDAEDDRNVCLNTIGPMGSPDRGFQISNVSITGDVADFSIDRGVLFVGGLRLEMDDPETYHNQKDWIRQTDTDKYKVTLKEFQKVSQRRYDLVYIEAWQQEVSAVEDNELFDVALGGPDTATRVRTMRRVRIAKDVGAPSCSEAWAKLKEQWAAEGTLGPDMELESG